MERKNWIIRLHEGSYQFNSFEFFGNLIEAKGKALSHLGRQNAYRPALETLWATFTHVDSGEELFEERLKLGESRITAQVSREAEYQDEYGTTVAQREARDAKTVKELYNL